MRLRVPRAVKPARGSTSTTILEPNSRREVEIQGAETLDHRSADDPGVGGDSELFEGDRGGAEPVARQRGGTDAGVQEVGLVEREPDEQDRPVLEDRAAVTDLGRSAQLPVADPQVGPLLAGEAHRTGRTVVAGDGGVDAQ